jgi:UDP-GlcNAc3NAcA epimerase
MDGLVCQQFLDTQDTSLYIYTVKLMKIISIVGARPQFIKAAPVSLAMRGVADEIIVHTGQHYDDMMSAVFFHELGIPEPKYNLKVGSGNHGWQTGQMLTKIEKVLMQENPNWVLVYGDTNSTLAGALAAAKLNIKVAHVEAGLRSFNREMPEEINRIVADHLSNLLFCPSRNAVNNLTAEGIINAVHIVGDVMADSIILAKKIAGTRSNILSQINLSAQKYLLATVHRAENTDNENRLLSILEAFNKIKEKIFFPVHPRTKKIIKKLGFKFSPNVICSEPLGYIDMIATEMSARMILTDSGGIQKEAYWLGVPCITLRDETEWVETVETGWNVLVGSDQGNIIGAVNSYKKPETHFSLYGDVPAAAKIVNIICQAQSIHDAS